MLFLVFKIIMIMADAITPAQIVSFCFLQRLLPQNLYYYFILIVFCAAWSFSRSRVRHSICISGMYANLLFQYGHSAE